ncbi:MAG: hypothetical protein ABIJ08_05295 [Nanoarchaeota archaeon]
MKKLLCPLVFILAILVISVVMAEDIALKVNDNDISSVIEVAPNGKLVLEVDIAANILIKYLKVEAKNEFIRQLVQEQMQNFRSNERKDISEIRKSTINLPGILPAGRHDLFVKVKYNDANFQDKEISKKIPVNIAGSGFMSGLVGGITGGLSQAAAAEVVDTMIDREIEPLSRQLTDEEVRNVAEELGLSQDDIKNGNYELKEIAQKESDGTITNDQIDEMISATDNIETKAALTALKGMNKPTVKKSLSVFELSKDGRSAYQSKVIIGISHTTSINNVNIIEVIPKSTAENADELWFSDDVEILEADPIVKWNFEHIPKGQIKEYSYVVNKKLEEIESKTIAACSEPGFFAKLIASIVKMFIQ